VRLLAERLLVRVGWVARIFSLLVRVGPLGRIGVRRGVVEHMMGIAVLRPGRKVAFVFGHSRCLLVDRSVRRCGNAELE
jgi:hypothetical protein